MNTINNAFSNHMLILLIIIFISSDVILQAQETGKIDELFSIPFEELMDIKITTAGKKEEKISDIPASIVIITRDDIEKYGFRTLDEIFKSVPGLYFINDYYYGGFGIRGFWSGIESNNVVILVNGIDQVYDYTSTTPLAKTGVQVEAIDKIEIVRGPMSVIYGSGAFYGVINIVTNEVNRNNPLNQISGSYGNNNTNKATARISDQKDDFKYVFNASMYNTDGIDQPLKKMVRNLSLLPFYGLNEDSRTGGKLSGAEKYFNFSGSFKKFMLELSFLDSRNSGYFLMPSAYNKSLSHLTSGNISFRYKDKLSEIISVEGKFSYAISRAWSKYNFLTPDFYGIQQNESGAYEFEFNTFITPFEKFDITAGLYQRTIFDAYNMYDLPSLEKSPDNPTLLNNYFSLSDNNEIIKRAFFTQVNYFLLDNLKLVMGARFEQMPKYKLGVTRAGGTKYMSKAEGNYDKDNIEIIPRFALLYSINSNNVLKFLYGKATNRPSFFQNTKNTLDPVHGNLIPESIQTIELNYISNLSPGVMLNVSIFRNMLDNLVTRLVEYNNTGGYQSWSANAGQMVTNGVELVIQYEPFGNLFIDISGTYQKTKDMRTGYENITAAYSPNFLGYAKVLFKFNKNVSFAITCNYIDEMESFWDETIINPDNTKGNRIGDKVKGYFELGANLRAENIFDSGLFLNFRGSNLLNTDILFPTSTSNQWATKGTLGSGSSILVSAGYKF